MKRFGLPKSSLLRKKGQFDRVYQIGWRLHGPNFSLIYAPNDGLDNRLGISVPKKVGRAVLRNRIKRVIRETFRLKRSLFPAGCDIVITVRPGFDLCTLATFHEAVTRLTRREQPKRSR